MFWADPSGVCGFQADCCQIWGSEFYCCGHMWPAFCPLVFPVSQPGDQVPGVAFLYPHSGPGLPGHSADSLRRAWGSEEESWKMLDLCGESSCSENPDPAGPELWFSLTYCSHKPEVFDLPCRSQKGISCLPVNNEHM